MNKILTLCLVLIALTAFAQSNKEIDSLKTILQANTEDTATANTINDLCTKLRAIGDIIGSKTYAGKELSLCEKIGFKKGEANAYVQLGNNDNWLGNYSDASREYYKTLKIRESLNDFRGIANVFLNIGNVNLYQKNYQDALINYYHSLEMQKRVNSKSGLANAYTCIAIVKSEQNKQTEAIDNYGLALKLYEELGRDIDVARISMGMSEIYVKQNNYTDATKGYDKSLSILEKAGDNKGRAECYSDMGILLFKQHKFYDAKQVINKSIILSEQTKSKSALKIAYEIRAKVDSAMGDFKSAYIDHQMFSIFKDSLFSESSTRKIVQSQMQYEFEKRENTIKAEQNKKDAIIAQEKQKQRIITYSIAGGLLLVIVFAGFIFRSLRITRKQKNIIELQKNEVYRQKEIVEEQKKLVEEKSKETTDNINYAKRIQDALMTQVSYIQDVLPNSFSLNIPRDIVSGDFLFLEKYKEEIIVAVADCTNHSVSGSLMTILCHNLLSEAVALDIHSPADILNYINITLAKKFHQTDGSKKDFDIVKDGMDVTLVKLDLANMKYQYAGAYNPLLIARDNQLLEIKADKLQLGQAKTEYKNNEGELQKGDTLFLSSDGYADQFSIDGKKFMKKKFKELLLSVSQNPVSEQKNTLEETITSWKNGYEQTDDILVMGIKI